MDTATVSSTSLSTIEGRIQKAAEVLKVQETEFQSIVKATFGIELNAEGLQMLDAQTTTEQVIVEMLSGYGFPKLCLLATSAILKGRDPFSKENVKSIYQEGSGVSVKNDLTVEGSVIAHEFVELTKNLRDPKQMKDKELLEMFNEDRDYEVLNELHKRAGFQFFVVLKPGQEGKVKKDIDIEMSLDLLKRSRRMTNPSLVRQGETFVNIYRITELDPEDQIVELCPFCGEIVYKNFCEKCSADFGNTGDDEKVFIKLVTEMESFDKNSLSDRRAVLASASKGLDDLRKTWPRVNKKYEELKVIGELPKLKKNRSLPSSKPADPFHVSGNRTF
jgi:hypothetical protein